MNKLQSFIQSKPCGFITTADLPELIKLDRLCPLLVRCGSCRFTAGAQYIEHLIKCIDAGGDYIRDVSFPVGALERAASWQPDCPVTPVSMLPASFTADRPARSYTCPHCNASFPEDECNTHRDQITDSKIIACPKCSEEFSEPARPRADRIASDFNRAFNKITNQDFNESDCGGVFDGFSVQSDADPGL